jgi:hypothetical protein
VRLLVNGVNRGNHWLGLRLAGAAPGRDMLGARVGITRSGAPTLWRHAHADGSYASSNDPRVLVGLGQSKETPGARVIWPGRTEEWHDLAIDRFPTLVEGTGR